MGRGEVQSGYRLAEKIERIQSGYTEGTETVQAIYLDGA